MAIAVRLLEEQPGREAAQASQDRRGGCRAGTTLLGTLSRSVGPDLPVVVLNLSLDGVLLETSEAPHPCTPYRLCLNVFGDDYCAPLTVVRHVESSGTSKWGCRLLLTLDQTRCLRRAMDAALGLAHYGVRAWTDVAEDARHRHRDDQLVVGHTASGHDIRASRQDCLDLGPEGLALFVRTVSSLETL